VTAPSGDVGWVGLLAACWNTARVTPKPCLNSRSPLNISGMSDVIIAQAAVFHRAASPLSVEFVRVLPLRRGEVRVRMKTAGVCHGDLHAIKGDLATPVPVICGHEGAGVIESVGEGVASVRPGDRVIPIWRSLVRAVRIWSVGGLARALIAYD
jgi:Alcohol dehydrogenase GroES-like domain